MYTIIALCCLSHELVFHKQVLEIIPEDWQVVNYLCILTELNAFCFILSLLVVIMANTAMRRRLSIGPMITGFAEGNCDCPDVEFVVGPSFFQAHSRILIEVSNVFKTMFCGSFSNEKRVVLQNIEPFAFENFLKLIYNGTRSTLPMMSPKDIVDCMIVANRFLVEELEELMKTKLVRRINAENALVLLSICDITTLRMLEIQSKCWSVIERATKQVLTSQAFLDITWHRFCDILENGRLSVNEFVLFQALVRWAKNQQRHSKFAKMELREIIGVAIYKIRFPLMTKGEFAQVKQSGLLNEGEIQDLENNFRKNETFPNQPRRSECLCRKEKRECPLCVSYITRSVAGPLVISPSRRKLLMTNRKRSKQQLLDVNQNVSPISKNIRQDQTRCECLKYRSCPDFPNGTTGKILICLGFI